MDSLREANENLVESTTATLNGVAGAAAGSPRGRTLRTKMARRRDVAAAADVDRAGCYAPLMSIALVFAALLLLGFLYFRSRKQNEAVTSRETTPALDTWIADALEVELAEGALGMRASTPEERRKLAKSLRGEPDPDVVSKIEDKVKAVELEFVKYAHETEAEVTIRVRYEDGNAGTATKRLAFTDVPEGVRADFASRSGTRVFRTWTFPWARVRVL